MSDDPVLSMYIGTFCPRDDLYVRDSRLVVREPITEEVISGAMLDGYAVSAYMARDGRSHVVALDFDREDGLDKADAVRKALGKGGIGSILCESRRGAHLWVVLGPDPSGQPPEVWFGTRLIRCALALVDRDLLNDKTVEVFPHRGADLAVGALRLPMMTHPKTKVRYPVYAKDWVPVKSIKALVLDTEVTTYRRAHDWMVGLDEEIYKIAGATKAPKSLGNYALKPHRDPTRGDEEPSACAVLESWGVPSPRPGTTVKCPKHEDRQKSLTIFKDDHRVFCGAPACSLHGEGHGVGSFMLVKM